MDTKVTKIYQASSLGNIEEAKLPSRGENTLIDMETGKKSTVEIFNADKTGLLNSVILRISAQTENDCLALYNKMLTETEIFKNDKNLITNEITEAELNKILDSGRKKVESLKRNPYQEKNFKIQPLEGVGQGFAVRSDSEKFGDNAIVFQGTSYDECLKYISDKVDVPKPTYYVIKDGQQIFCKNHYENETGHPAEKIAIERFDTVDEAIAKFNEYKSMDYLKETVHDINDPTQLARRLMLGVAADIPGRDNYVHGELDLLHTQGDKTLLIDDILRLRENGYDGFMIMDTFIKEDLPKIIEGIKIDEYSGYRKQTVEDIAKTIMDGNGKINFQNALKEAERKVSYKPELLNKTIPFKIPMSDFKAPFLKETVPNKETESILSSHKEEAFDNVIKEKVNIKDMIKTNATKTQPPKSPSPHKDRNNSL